jgi:hypothetical protein
MAPIDDWKSRAVEVMRQPDNVRAVEILSARLERDGCIDGQLFDVVLSSGGGGSSDNSDS